VRVSARNDAENKAIIFSAHDTGIGIAPQDQERIFEEFEQIETRLRTNVKGTGLGLPLSRSLAGPLGGQIELETVVARGSVFRLSIRPVSARPRRPAAGA
jgi:signal transduction histidine kinase